MTPTFCIKWSNLSADGPCALCDGIADSEEGPSIFVEGSYSGVCYSCATQLAPELVTTLAVVNRYRPWSRDWLAGRQADNDGYWASTRIPTCPRCGKPYGLDSCIENPFDEWHGESPMWEGGPMPTRPCNDCGVALGGYHHANCDMTRCRRCGGQLLSCGHGGASETPDSPPLGPPTRLHKSRSAHRSRPTTGGRR